MSEFKFPSKQLVVTAGINARMQEDLNFMEHVRACIWRHFKGDWGDMDAEDKATNEESLEGGGRLMSAYAPAEHPKIWIITEWDRSVTTVLFPEEY